MAKGFNKVILMGNLTRDPETRTTSSGQSVTRLSLAVNRTWRSADGQQQEAVSFIDCVAWGKPGEIIAQYVQKGRALLVSGRLEQSSWDDKESGQKRSKIEVVVEDFNFVDSGQGSGSDYSAPAKSSEPTKGNKAEEAVEDIDDRPIDLSEIPF